MVSELLAGDNIIDNIKNHSKSIVYFYKPVVGGGVGAVVGAWVGAAVGAWVGAAVGAWVGAAVGAWVGAAVGAWVGAAVGAVVVDPADSVVIVLLTEKAITCNWKANIYSKYMGRHPTLAPRLKVLKNFILWKQRIH